MGLEIPTIRMIRTDINNMADWKTVKKKSFLGINLEIMIRKK
jgi:hypothetical protein